jgi:serralysin
MILRSVNTGQFEVYNIVNNQITSANSLGTIGLNFQVAGFGDFNADGTTDMMLRSTSSGQFELYDIVNNQITSAFNIGTVGLDFQVAGFADFNRTARPT